MTARLPAALALCKAALVVQHVLLTVLRKEFERLVVESEGLELHLGGSLN